VLERVGGFLKALKALKDTNILTKGVHPSPNFSMKQANVSLSVFLEKTTKKKPRNSFLSNPPRGAHNFQDIEKQRKTIFPKYAVPSTG